jgi:molybdate transport system substrate-binding protein
VKIVLAAEEVPAGKYARQVLDNLNATLGADYKDKVLANVVSNDNDIRQVLARVELGEADAGIVYVSDAGAAPELGKLDIPSDANVVAQYPIAPLAGTLNPDLATAFVGYVLSTEGQATLEKWGFMPASP